MRCHRFSVIVVYLGNANEDRRGQDAPRPQDFGLWYGEFRRQPARTIPRSPSRCIRHILRNRPVRNLSPVGTLCSWFRFLSIYESTSSLSAKAATSSTQSFDRPGRASLRMVFPVQGQNGTSIHSPLLRPLSLIIPSFFSTTTMFFLSMTTR